MKQAKQPRSQASADRIVAAAERLVAQGGLSALGLAGVLREAGVSVGSFYARFGGKNALVRHLGDRFWARVRAEWADRLDPGRWIGQPASAIVDGFAREAVRAHRQHWSIIRALVEYGLANPDARLLKPAREHDGFVVTRLGELLLVRRHEIHHPDPALAIELACLQVTGALRTLILVGWPKTDRGAVGDDTLAAELARSVRRYLDVRGRS